MNLKESGEGHKGVFGGDKFCTYIMMSKMKGQTHTNTQVYEKLKQIGDGKTSTEELLSSKEQMALSW